MIIEPEIKDQREFNVIKNINPKEKIDQEYGIRLQEPSEYSEGYVFLYKINTGKIVTRMFWNFNTEYGVCIPQPNMVETYKEYFSKGLSLLVYKELIDIYGGLISDDRLTIASLNNWSKKIMPIYKRNIYKINDKNIELWDGSIANIINSNFKLIILLNNLDIKRLKRKYNT